MKTVGERSGVTFITQVPGHARTFWQERFAGQLHLDQLDGLFIREADQREAISHYLDDSTAFEVYQIGDV